MLLSGQSPNHWSLFAERRRQQEAIRVGDQVGGKALGRVVPPDVGPQQKPGRRKGLAYQEIPQERVVPEVDQYNVSRSNPVEKLPSPAAKLIGQGNPQFPEVVLSGRPD
jgi:hypothetical protein